MIIIDPIIDRVELLLGDTYNIRSTYNPIDLKFFVTITRKDSDWKLEMIFSEMELELNKATMDLAISKAIISNYNEWVNTYGKNSKS